MRNFRVGHAQTQAPTTDAEKKAFDSSVAHVRELVEAMDKVLAA